MANRNVVINWRTDKRTKDRVSEVSKILKLSMTDVVQLVMDGRLDIWQNQPEIKPPGKGDRP